MKTYLLIAVAAGAALSAGAAWADEDNGLFVIGGVDATEGSQVAYLGVGARPGASIDSDGIMLRGAVAYGRYEYDRGLLPDGDGRLLNVDAMIGYQWVGDTDRRTIYVGANFQSHDVDNDPLNPVQGDDWGFKVQAEYYNEPSHGMMVLGVANYSTANESYYALGRIGWRVGSGNMFVGPEVGANGDARYNQWRAGAHITGFRVGPLGLGASLGYSAVDPGADGIFGTVGFTLRY